MFLNVHSVVKIILTSLKVKGRIRPQLFCTVIIYVNKYFKKMEIKITRENICYRRDQLWISLHENYYMHRKTQVQRN